MQYRLSVNMTFPSQGALATLGIPFVDVLRILVAILLLGNVEFVDGEGLELDVKGNNGRYHLYSKLSLKAQLCNKSKNNKNKITSKSIQNKY